MNQLSIFDKLSEYFRPNYYNTTHLPEPELKKEKLAVKFQDERVLDIFKQSGVKMTPWECSQAYDRLFPAAPITSIRRAITDLTGQGLLKKCIEQKTGGYGKKNYTWVYDKKD